MKGSIVLIIYLFMYIFSLVMFVVNNKDQFKLNSELYSKSK
jgi:hypothetical protein